LTVDVSNVSELSPGNFFPAPNVQSSFVRVTPKPDRAGVASIDDELLRAIERVARAAFNQRRKTIANALRGAKLVALESNGGPVAALERAGIDPRLRAERVPLDRWLALGREFRLCDESHEERD
jgi:16S rRNA (adenine1518-N6/adenine1519-N6)-dimethyltransferase